MTIQTITMIDYGASNIRSAQKAFEHIGATVQLTEDPEVVRRAEKLVLPGVGAFGSGMDGLRQRDLPHAIHEAVVRGVPFLGICVGMQLLFDESDEMGIHQGLSLIPGKVTRFPEQLTMNNEQLTMDNEQLSAINENNEPIENRQSKIVNLKVPHMGWNQLEHDGTHWLLHGVQDGDYAYFVHSYHCIPDDEADTVARTEYGRPFTAIVARDNVYGLQFHPEKSQHVGLQILRNFMEKE